MSAKENLLDKPADLINAPLRTPELVAIDTQSALSVRPAWLHDLHLEYPEGHEEDAEHHTPAVTIVLGRKRVTSKGLSALQLAFLIELTRFPGISLVTNSDGKGRWYVRISIADHPEDLTTAVRVFSNATEFVEAKVSGIQSDMRTENLKHGPAGKVSKDARHVVLGHAARIAKQVEESGRMPDHLTAKAYLENTNRLLHLSDLEATGLELSDLLHLIPSHEAVATEGRA